MDTTKRPPLDRLLFATFLKGRTSSRDVWEEYNGIRCGILNSTNRNL